MNKRYLLVLWLTGRCNLNCRYCYASENHAVYDMNFKTAKAAIDRFASVPIKIQFAGGEPLLNFELAEQICRYVRSKGIDAVFQIQTNGTLLDEYIIKKMKEYAVSIGVSLDGIPEINQLTRGKTVQAIQGIQLLGVHGITTGLNTVVTAKNVNQLYKLIDFSLYLGNVGGIGLDLLRYVGRGAEECDQLKVSSEELKNALKRMAERSRELYQLFGKKIQIREIEIAKKRLQGKGEKKNYCYASCGRSVVVLPSGETYPCGSLIEPQYYMGNIECIEEKAIVHLRQNRKNDCNSCKYERYCPKGCPSRIIRNQDSLDCVLLKTSFELAEEELRMERKDMVF